MPDTADVTQVVNNSSSDGAACATIQHMGMCNARSSRTMQVRKVHLHRAASAGNNSRITAPLPPLHSFTKKVFSRAVAYMLYVACTVPQTHTHALPVYAAAALQDGLEVKTKDKEMRRVLSLFQLSAFGIPAIVGRGIFVVTGVQAKLNAG
jgi:hypothetical protein